MILSQAKVIRVGKKGEIYLPRSVVRKLGMREGDRAILRVEEGGWFWSSYRTLCP